MIFTIFKYVEFTSGKINNRTITTVSFVFSYL